MKLRILLAGAAAGALLFAACSTSSDSKATPTPAQAAATSSTAAQPTTVASATAKATTAATSAATSGATAAATKAAAGRVSANNATRAELTAAFEAAGIPSAANWAREVEEYRPYATTDANLSKLRQNLAKYNPGPGVVDQIVAALSLP